MTHVIRSSITCNSKSETSWPGVKIQNVSNQLVHGTFSNFVPPELIFRELKTYLAVQMSQKKLHVANTETYDL